MRNIPATVSDDDVQEYIETKLDDEIQNMEINVKREKKTARIYTDGKIPGKKVLDAVNKIQFTTTKEKVFGNPLYCRIIKDLTPTKENNEKEKNESAKGTPIKENNELRKNDISKDTSNEANTSQANQFSKLLKSPVLPISRQTRTMINYY